MLFKSGEKWFASSECLEEVVMASELQYWLWTLECGNKQGVTCFGEIPFLNNSVQLLK